MTAREEIKAGWREARWEGSMYWRLAPLSLGIALLITPEVPWPRWIVWALFLLGAALSALLMRKHWYKPENGLLRAWRSLREEEER